MPDTTTDLRALLPELTADAARDLAQEFDSQGDSLKRRARALFAFADALDDGAGGSGADRASRQAGGNGTSRATPAAPPSNKRPLIRAIIEERPVPAWKPNEIIRTLVERRMIPPETSAASIRVTLRRMLEGGELARTPDRRYTIPGREQEGTLS